MVFRRRQKSGEMARHSDMGSGQEPVHYVQIEFDMMLKGSVYPRRKGLVRQFGVTVGGATRLVTSGDKVDLDTYNALVAAGAIRPLPPDVTPMRTRPPALVDNLTVELPEE